MSNSGFFNSSLTKKYIMAFSGLFLCIFLLGHVAGNVQLVFGTKDGFNEYAKFMTTNPAVFVLRILTALSIIAHVVMAIRLTLQNKAARPVSYTQENANSNSDWTSRYMAHMGLVILAFIAIHLYNFAWKTMSGGLVEYVSDSGEKLHDLYTITVGAFKDPLFTGFYVVSIVFVAFHLVHGVKSAFQSVGINHSKYNQLIKNMGYAFAILVPGLFIFIAIALFIK